LVEAKEEARLAQFIGNGKQQRPFIRGKHGKLMRLSHLERDVPRVSGPKNDAAVRGNDAPPLADELSQPPPAVWRVTLRWRLSGGIAINKTTWVKASSEIEAVSLVSARYQEYGVPQSFEAEREKR
jgi:hypothetical protein